MDDFLHEYNLPQLTQEEIKQKQKTKNLNKLIKGDRVNCNIYTEKGWEC